MKQSRGSGTPACNRIGGGRNAAYGRAPFSADFLQPRSTPLSYVYVKHASGQEDVYEIKPDSVVSIDGFSFALNGVAEIGIAEGIVHSDAPAPAAPAAPEEPEVLAAAEPAAQDDLEPAAGLDPDPEPAAPEAPAEPAA